MSERRRYPSDLSDARWELVEPVLTANNLATQLPFVRRSRGLALMSALSMRTPLDLNALVSLPIRARASLSRNIQIQAMRDRRLPRAVRGFLRQLMDALPPAGAGPANSSRVIKR